MGLPVLGTVTGDFKLVSADELTRYSAPMFGTVGEGSNVWSNPMLVSFSAPVLTTVGGLSFTDNEVLTSFDVPVLTTVSGDFSVSGNLGLGQLQSAVARDRRR